MRSRATPRLRAGERATVLPGRARAWTDAFPPAAPSDYNSVMSAILHSDGRYRCPWPKQDPLYVTYHDEEWGVPERDDRALYEKLVLDGFQAGLSWITILRKRDNFRRAFDGFAPETVAAYGERKVAALMNDAGIVRNRAKIEGAILSARGYLDIMAKGPGFSTLLWEFRRRRAPGEPPPEHCRGAGRDAGLPGHLKGARLARLQVRRPDHRLRLHAGGRHGQRPPGQVLLPPGQRGEVEPCHFGAHVSANPESRRR